MSVLPEFEFAPLDSEEEIKEPQKPVQQPVDKDEPEDLDTEQTVEPSTGDDEDHPDEFDDDDIEHYKSLYSFYKDEGLIQHDGEFSGKPDEFADILRRQREMDMEMAEDALVNMIPEKLRAVLQVALNNAGNISDEQVLELYQIRKDVESIPESFDDEEAARKFLIKTYKEQGEESAEDIVSVFEDKGILLDKANTIAKARKEEKEKQELSYVEESRKQKQQREAEMRKLQNGVVETLQSLPWEENRKAEVYNQIFNKELNRKTRLIAQHPKALVQLANYLSFLDENKGEIDESLFTKQAETKAIKKVKNSIERNFSRSDVGSGGSTGTKSRKGNNNVQYEFAD